MIRRITVATLTLTFLAGISPAQADLVGNPSPGRLRQCMARMQAEQLPMHSFQHNPAV
jgi:hypothetical protein